MRLFRRRSSSGTNVGPNVPEYSLDVVTSESEVDTPRSTRASTPRGTPRLGALKSARWLKLGGSKDWSDGPDSPASPLGPAKRSLRASLPWRRGGSGQDHVHDQVSNTPNVGLPAILTKDLRAVQECCALGHAGVRVPGADASTVHDYHAA